MAELDTAREVSKIFERGSGHVFLIDAVTDRRYTYDQFHEAACRVSRMFHAHGIRHQDRVALVLNNSAEFAAMYFGCLFLGAVAVPINPGLHPREIAFALTRSGAKLVVYSPTTKMLIPEITRIESAATLCLVPLREQDQADSEPEEWFLDAEPAPEIPRWRPMMHFREDDLFSITFTSGTTSMPKGVAHRATRLFENADAFNKQLGFESGNRMLHVMAMAYMAGFLNTLLCPFVAGAGVVIDRAFDAQSALGFWRPVIKYRADTMWVSPTMLAALWRVDRDQAGLEYCRQHVDRICVGTAPLTLKTKTLFEQKYGVELLESYGLSELLFVSGSSKRFQHVDGSVGRVLPAVEVRVVDEHGGSLPQGEDGDILIKTPHVMDGYLDPDTQELDTVSTTDWFDTGDIGHLDRDRYLFITGRKKDVIVRGGINISPRAVEAILLKHEAVDVAAVVGLPHDFYGEEVVAAVKLNNGYHLGSIRRSLNALCKQNLNSASAPTRFFELDELPRSATGKVQTQKLRELLAARTDSESISDA